MKPERPITVLVIDDSAANRRALTEHAARPPRASRSSTGPPMARRASRRPSPCAPDVITLDLEMPRLDGYAFLRLLMARAPTPVIVVSSYGHPSDVFKALQLGAFDFVAKPTEGDDASPRLGARRADREGARRRASCDARSPRRRRLRPAPQDAQEEKPAARPRAGWCWPSAPPPAGRPRCRSCSSRRRRAAGGVVVAQHMPPRFTQAFAERLDKTLRFRVREAQTVTRCCPGEVVHRARRRAARGAGAPRRAGTLRVTPPSPAIAHAPSVDRLFLSVARAAGPQAHAVVLTGMGHDGAKGVRALGEAGVPVWAEAEASAVVFGMPEAAIATGHVVRVLPLDELGPRLAEALEARAYRSRR